MKLYGDYYSNICSSAYVRQTARKEKIVLTITKDDLTIHNNWKVKFSSGMRCMQVNEISVNKLTSSRDILVVVLLNVIILIKVSYIYYIASNVALEYY